MIERLARIEAQIAELRARLTEYECLIAELRASHVPTMAERAQAQIELQRVSAERQWWLTSGGHGEGLT